MFGLIEIEKFVTFYRATNLLATHWLLKTSSFAKRLRNNYSQILNIAYDGCEGNFIAKCRTFVTKIGNCQFFRSHDDVSFRMIDCNLPVTRNYNHFPIKLCNDFQMKPVQVFSSLK
jgi:hypothetical protein